MQALNSEAAYNDSLESMLTIVNVDENYLHQLFDIYHQRLLHNQHLIDKLSRRGICREAIANNYIGVCDRSLNRYIDTSSKSEGAGFRGTLRRVGLTKENGHEVFRGCVVEPVYIDDRLVAVCGIKHICPSRKAPRIIQWYRDTIYELPINFFIMAWGVRYVH
jgi:hypothetical protein